MSHNQKLIDGIPIKYVCQPCPECKAKLEAGEEMAEALSDAVENCETCRGERGPRKCARCLTFEKLLSAWKKAGKGEGI